MVFRNLPLNLPDFTAAAMFPPCLKFDKNMHVIIANIEYKIRVQKIMWKNLLIFQSKITCENVHFTHVQKSQTPNYCYYLYSLKLLEKKIENLQQTTPFVLKGNNFLFSETLHKSKS